MGDLAAFEHKRLNIILRYLAAESHFPELCPSFGKVSGFLVMRLRAIGLKVVKSSVQQCQEGHVCWCYRFRYRMFQFLAFFCFIPSSVLVSSKHCSIAQRSPLSQTKVSSLLEAAASLI